MPDPLDRTVDARIDAFRPGTVPPFAAIEARKRGRDRRRVAVGAAALSLVALAAAGAAVPSLAGGDRLATGAGSPGAANSENDPAQARESVFRVVSDGTADPAAYTAAVENCLALPGVTGGSVEKSYPANYMIAVRADRSQALEGCLRAAPGAGVTAISGPAHDSHVPSTPPAPVVDAPVCPEGYECGESGRDNVPRCGPGVADEPCAAGLEEGQTYRYVLHTHCGVKGLYADGREWVPEAGQDVGQNGAPAGFGDPEDYGSVRLISDQRLDYRSSSGVALRFVPGQLPEDDCN